MCFSSLEEEITRALALGFPHSKSRTPFSQQSSASQRHSSHGLNQYSTYKRAEICNTEGDTACNFTTPLSSPFQSAPLATYAHVYYGSGYYPVYAPGHLTIITPSGNTGGNLTLNYLSPAGCHGDINTYVANHLLEIV